MIPVFVTPFEELAGAGAEDELPELKRILGLDFPHPALMFTQQRDKGTVANGA